LLHNLSIWDLNIFGCQSLCVQQNILYAEAGGVEKLCWYMCCAVAFADAEMHMRKPGAIVYAVFDYSAENADELTFSVGDQLTVIECDDDIETEWWWCQLDECKGYVPQNLIAVSSCFM